MNCGASVREGAKPTDVSRNLMVITMKALSLSEVSELGRHGFRRGRIREINAGDINGAVLDAPVVQIVER